MTLLARQEGHDGLPALIDRAARALSNARTSGEVLEARDAAQVAYDAAKLAGRMARAKKAHDEVIAAVYRAQGDALLIEARAKMRLADEYDEAQDRGEVAGHGGGRNFKVAGGNVEATAADLGLRRDEIHEARELRNAERAAPGVIEAAIQERVEARQEPTKAAVKQAVEAVTKPHVAQNSGNNEWYTPPAFIEAARRVMGGIDLDPATSEIANRTVQAARIFTAEDDGLAQEWPVGRIWMNPPYAQPLIGQFAERLAQEVERGSEAIVLVNNGTETAWFQRMGAVCSAVCFPKARVKFLDPQGNPGAPLQGQAVIYCGPNVGAFVEAFSGFGMVLRHG
jgi:hypothetical protein